MDATQEGNGRVERLRWGESRMIGKKAWIVGGCLIPFRYFVERKKIELKSKRQ